MDISRRRFLEQSAAATAGLIAAPSLARLAGGRSDGAFFEWTLAREGVLATQGLAHGGNSMVVLGEGGSLLVDTKFPPLGPILKAESAVQGGRITAVLNTHHHADHTGGNISFTREVPVYAHRRALQRIADQVGRYQQMLEAAPKQVLPELQGTDAVKQMDEIEALIENARNFTAQHWIPNERLDDGESKIEVGGVTVHLTHAGAGHTDNDVFVYVPHRNVLHTGDLVFHGLNPYVDRSAGANTAGWIASCKAMLKLCDDDTVVIPGHGNITDRSGIQGQIDYFERVRAYIEERTGEGATVAQIRAAPPEWMLELGFPQFAPMVLGEVHAEMAAGG